VSDELNNILSLLKVGKKNNSNPWCCLDITGNLITANTDFYGTLHSSEAQLKSLFQFNPEWNFLTWQKIIKELSTTESKNKKTMLIDAKAEVSSSEILLSKFHMGDQTYVKYTLLDQQEGEKQNENVTATIVNSPASKEKNYDDLAPNAVLYFDQNGNVYYENQVSKRLFANSVIGKHVDTLFLETELGEVLSGIKAYPTKDKEILVRMIIKSKPKLKDGYGRFFELDNNGDIYYRLEYLEQLIVKVNCASIPKELIESILFGHEKGAFTGADSKKIGKFELADKGTIFLDEIGELPLDLQPKLLRVLQEGEIERVGNPEPIKVDVRVIAATNRDLHAEAKKGNFRQDLYYRLNIFPIFNIPLRERSDDIPLLIEHFLKKSNNRSGRKVSHIRTRDISLLEKYTYPGNVRELENIIHRAVILSEDETANFDFLTSSNSNNENDSGFLSLEDQIRKHIIEALDIVKGKITGKGSASEILGINGKTLASKIKKLDIDVSHYKTND